MSETPRPEDLFRDYVNRRESERPLAADELCRSHPEHAATLRTLIDEYERLRGDLHPPQDAPESDGLVRVVLGEYELVRELGRGAMGSTVWLGKHRRLGRLAAIKVLPRSLGPRFERRFEREAHTAARLSHRAVVPIYEHWATESTLCLAMRFVDGPSLQYVIETVARWSPKHRTRDRIQGGITGKITDFSDAEATPSPRAASVLEPSYVDLGLEIFAEVARGLHHAHENHVIHRDVKPGNILLDRSLQPYLADFGLAREASNPAASTFPGFFGTFAYAAPEQLFGGAISPQTDIFSMGASLYEWVTLEPPRRQDDGPTPLHLKQSLAVLPKDLATVLARCLEPHPQDRYASAQAFADDLARLRRGDPPLAKRIGPVGRLARATRRHARRIAIGVGAAAAISLGAGLFVTTRAERSRAREQETWDSRVEASFAYNNGDVKTSRESMERAVRLSGENPDVLAEASLMKASAGDLVKALDDLDRALEKRPDAGDLRRRRADLLVRLKRPDAATEERTRAEPMKRGVWDDYFEGSDFRRRGQMVDAVMAYTRCLIERPTFIPALNKMIQIDRERELPLEALALTERLCGERGPRGYLALLRGDLRLQLHDPDGARKEFDRVLEGGSFANSKDLFDGLIAAAEGSFENAVVAFSKGVESHPEVLRYLVERGTAYYQLQRFVEAEKDYRSYVEKGPANWQGLHNLGLLCWRTGRNDEAVQWFDRALQVIPNNLPTIRERCIALSTLSRWPELLDAARHAIERFPDEVEIAAEGSHAAVELRRYADALELSALAERLDASPALAQNHALSNLLACRGDALYFGTGDYARAVPFYRRAYDADPGANRAKSLAQGLRKLGRHEEALTLFQRAASIHDDYRTEQDINVCLQVLERYDEAEAAANRALELVETDASARADDRPKIHRERGRARMLAGRYLPALEDLVDSWPSFVGDTSVADDAETCALLGNDPQKAFDLVRGAAGVVGDDALKATVAVVETLVGDSEHARTALRAFRSANTAGFTSLRRRWIRRLIEPENQCQRAACSALAKAIVALDVEPVLTATAAAVSRETSPTSR
ncbi:MAG: tetratricopeptide repeat protein [Planctomycetes bacterium]|nr:tetratricopeptide repeat protein [Planctomycetota bacterium]MBI3845410.1 tetratricopeptide repeat protein [Planctomycetota bacterium]